MIRSDRPTIAVIIPVLDEAGLLPTTIASCAGADEVLVVDGGSTDGSVPEAIAAGARVVSCPPGRARQMNEGAARAAADVLLFLHADTHLPSGWTADVLRILAIPDTSVGAFRFGVCGAGPRDRLIGALGRARSELTQHPYGDQALFMRRSLFELVGGYPDQPIMEDWELVKRLKRHGRVRTTSSSASTSTRQWDRGGLLASTARYAAVVVGYRLGVSPERLTMLRPSAGRPPVAERGV